MTTLIDRFRGDAGRENLFDAIMQQAIVCGNRELAAEIAAKAELVDVPEGAAAHRRRHCEDRFHGERAVTAVSAMAARVTRPLHGPIAA